MAVTKFRKVKRLDCIRLDSTYFTKEGYFVDHPILTSTGIFEYLNSDGSIRRELRLPEHVFNKKSLKTYKGKPIIITHDAGIVNKSNVDDEQIGTILSHGYQDGDDVRAEIIIHNTDAMRDCGLKELSLGYDLDLIEEPGEWNGEKYDAIQTNIVINHLALVDAARAGEQARLNIDSRETALKGGKIEMKNQRKKSKVSQRRTKRNDNRAFSSRRKVTKKRTKRRDNGVLTPEQLEEAIALYCQQNGLTEDDDEAVQTTEETALDAEETVQVVKENQDRRDEEGVPETLADAMDVIAEQNEDIENLLDVIEQLQGNEENVDDDDENMDDDEENLDDDENMDDDDENCDDDDENMDDDEENLDDDDENLDDDDENMDDDEPSINADSADRMIRKRLSICRVGDKLNMDGLERMSIKSAKKAIIKKVMPTVRLDGKSNAYINAMYDIAVEKVNKRKGVNYQKKQMYNGMRADGIGTGMSSAAQARKKMIARREGGRR